MVPAGDEAAVAVAIASTPVPVALSSRGRNNSGESRGPWTPEEIRLLTEAHAMHPGYAVMGSVHAACHVAYEGSSIAVQVSKLGW